MSKIWNKQLSASIAKCVALTTGVSKSQFMGKRRSPNIVEARRLYFLACEEFSNATHEDISQTVPFTRQGVQKALSDMNAKRQNDPEYNQDTERRIARVQACLDGMGRRSSDVGPLTAAQSEADPV